MTQSKQFAILLTVLLSVIAARAQQEPKIVRVKALVSSESVQAEQPFEVDLHVRVRSSWHINSEDPDIDLLIPTTVRMENPERIELVEVVFPEATKRRFPYHKKPIPVFESRFTIALKLRMKPSAEPGPVTLQGILRFQACNRSSCLPPEELPFTVDVVVGEAPPAE